MRDIFVCPNGNMLENWEKAFPKALITISIRTVPVNEPVVFWVHANVNDVGWLKNTMADIQKKFQASKVVVLANTPNQQDALAVMAAGAVGYCHAYSDAKMLKELKTVVIHGGVWLGNDLLQSLIGATKPIVNNTSTNVEEALALLTMREKEIALEAAKGLSNKEIARTFNITERTVKAHISAVLEKLGVKDRLQLALVLNGKTSGLTSDAKQANSKVQPFKLAKTKNKKNKRSQNTKIKKKLEHAA